MDYAFAPGADFYHRAARQLMANRPNTQVIQQRGLNTVADFLTFLDAVPAVPAIQHPAGDLFVVSHGNDVAWLQIRLDGTQTGPTGYEQAEAAAASGSVHIPPSLNQNADGGLTSLAVNFRGCRIGAAGPFVDELKVAFGGNTAVTAPLHFHGIFELTGRVGLLELLAYGFTFVSKTAFADKAATAAAFDAIGFTYHDANALPTANWTAWVPSNVRVGHREGKPMYVSLGRTIGSQRTIGLKIEFRHDRPSFTYKITGLPGQPAGRDGKTDALRQALNDDAATAASPFAATHPFPVYKRYHHDSRDEFVDQMNWAFSWNPHGGVLACVGSQHEYTLRVPVTDPPDLATGKLIYNFYPPASSPLTAVDELAVSDATLFYTA